VQKIKIEHKSKEIKLKNQTFTILEIKKIKMRGWEIKKLKKSKRSKINTGFQVATRNAIDHTIQPKLERIKMPECTSKNQNQTSSPIGVCHSINTQGGDPQTCKLACYESKSNSELEGLVGTRFNVQPRLTDPNAFKIQAYML